MNTSNGTRRFGGMRIPIRCASGHLPRPTPPGKIYSTRSLRCLGCPYPRHGLICWSKSSENCLRSEMQELDVNWRDKHRHKLAGEPP